jgi:hypothetical protein
MPWTSAAPMPTAEQTAQTSKTARKLLRNVSCRALSSLVVSLPRYVGSASLRPAVALDQGLRRVLQLASRSYAMRYAPGPTGEVALQEVQVFAEAPAGDQSPAGAAHAGEAPEAEISRRFVDTLLQRQAAAPAVARKDESDAASRFRDALERNSAPAPGGTDAPESDAARRFRDALEDVTGATPR